MSESPVDTRGLRVGDVLERRYVVLRLRAEAPDSCIAYDTHTLCRVHLRVYPESGQLQVGEAIASHWSRRETDGAQAQVDAAPTAPVPHTVVPIDDAAERLAIMKTPTLPEGLVVPEERS